jgi:hypothetical protein
VRICFAGGGAVTTLVLGLLGESDMAKTSERFSMRKQGDVLKPPYVARGLRVPSTRKV